MFCKWCGMHIPAGTTKCQNCNREQEALSNGNIFEQIGIDNKVNTTVNNRSVKDTTIFNKRHSSLRRVAGQ